MNGALSNPSGSLTILSGCFRITSRSRGTNHNDQTHDRYDSSEQYSSEFGIQDESNNKGSNEIADRLYEDADFSDVPICIASIFRSRDCDIRIIDIEVRLLKTEQAFNKGFET